MLVQDFLRGDGTLAKLEELYGITAKRHSRYPELVLLKYDMIDSPMGEPIVQECRGLVLDSSKDWEIVAFAYRKFFNVSEGHAAPIEWSRAVAQEKLDGSLCFLYWYDGHWEVSTSGTPDASGQVDDRGFTFADLFWKTFNDMGLKLPFQGQESVTFMFELTSPYNRIVVPHKEAKVTLIGARNIKTGGEYSVETFCRHFPVVREFPLQTLQDIEKTFETMDPLVQEGYVILDPVTFNRVKVKHPGYVALHHLKDSMGASRRNILEIIRKGETSEFLKYFPEFQADFDLLKARYHDLNSELAALYQANMAIPVQKDFALAIKDCRLPGALFCLRAKKVVSIGHFMADMNIDNLLEILDPAPSK